MFYLIQVFNFIRWLISPQKKPRVSTPHDSTENLNAPGSEHVGMPLKSCVIDVSTAQPEAAGESSRQSTYTSWEGTETAAVVNTGIQPTLLQSDQGEPESVQTPQVPRTSSNFKVETRELESKSHDHSQCASQTESDLELGEGSGCHGSSSSACHACRCSACHGCRCSALGSTVESRSRGGSGYSMNHGGGGTQSHSESECGPTETESFFPLQHVTIFSVDFETDFHGVCLFAILNLYKQNLVKNSL